MSLVPIQTNSAATNAVAFGSSITTGSRIGVFTFTDTTAAVTSIADTLTNSYSLIKKQIQAASSAWPCEFWLSGASTSGANTVVVAFSGSANFLVIVTELPGLALVSPAGTPIGNSANTSANPSIGNITPASTGDIVICAVSNVNNKVATAGSGFTIPTNGTINGSGNGLALEYKIAPSTSAIACAFTMASSEWAGLAVSLAAAGGGGGGATINDHNYRGSNRGMGLGMGRGMSYHAHPEISLEAYRRDRARARREFMAKVSRRAA